MTQERTVAMTIKKLSNYYTRFMERTRKQANRKIGAQENSTTRLQGWIIDYLYAATGPVYQKDLETAFSIRHSTVSKTLKQLEEAGVVVRTTPDGDARYKELSLSDRARQDHPPAAAEFLRAEQQATEGIDPKDLETFLSVAEHIIRNLEK